MGGTVPQPPGRTPHSASRRASGTTQPQAPLRCPGGEDQPPEAREAPRAERPRGRQTTLSDRDDLLKVINDKAVVRGDFVLSSGQRASWYIDLRRVLLSGASAALAGRVMLAVTADLGYDAVGGLTLGADPVAAAMMHAAFV